MKLYNAIGSKPRSVPMFVAEKGIEVPPEEIDPLVAKTGASLVYLNLRTRVARCWYSNATTGACGRKSLPLA